jgi:hypothetical protein
MCNARFSDHGGHPITRDHQILLAPLQPQPAGSHRLFNPVKTGVEGCGL